MNWRERLWVSNFVNGAHDEKSLDWPDYGKCSIVEESKLEKSSALDYQLCQTRCLSLVSRQYGLEIGINLLNQQPD